MSQHHHPAPAGAGHGDLHDKAAHAGHETGHGSFKGYLTGFVLSVILTAIPFWLVMAGVIADSRMAGLAIMALAAVQIVVHMVYFLHMNTKSEDGWNFLALVFTLVIVVITIAGSLWVMYHLNTHMMMMQGHDMSTAPAAAGAPAIDQSQMP